MNNKKIKFIVYLTLLAGFYLFIGYQFNIFFFILPTIIILITYIFYPTKWKSYLGLNISRKYLMLFLICIPILQLIFYRVILCIIPQNILLGQFHYLNQLYTFGQCLSEELVFRALLLSPLLLKNYKKINILIAIIISSLLFSLLHWVINSYTFTYKGPVSLQALTTIFLFSLTTNLIYINTRNILLPLAIHFGWNSIRFGCYFIYKDNPEIRLPEYVTFNFLEGSNTILVLSLVYSLSVILFFKFFFKTIGKEK